MDFRIPPVGKLKKLFAVYLLMHGVTLSPSEREREREKKKNPKYILLMHGK